MTVYVDVLLAVNYAVNLLLLLIAARLLGSAAGKKRLCLAALLGAAGALAIFLPSGGFLLQGLYKLGLTFAMTAAAFGLRPWQRLFRALLALMVSSFLFAGLMLAIQFFWGGVLYQNGVVYFDVSALELVFWTAVAYGVLWLFERLFLGRTAEKKLCRVTVDLDGRQISFLALADTGNCLKEPFSGAPVIVCDGNLAERAAPGAERIRLVPCSTIAGGTVLEAFHPDSVRIVHGERETFTSDVYIAKSKEPIIGEYQAVLNPQLIDSNPSAIRAATK